MFSAFHVVVFVLTVTAAAASAMLCSKAISGAGSVSGTGSGSKKLSLTLSISGWILLALELYKQLFIYYIVNGGVYDWWYFPFQLCSVPMYLCILLPFIRNNSAMLTFMTGYTFLSAMAALIYPEDFLRPYISLTLHGFIWHGILLFISLTILYSGYADLSFRGFRNATALFILLCGIAVMINIFTEPLMLNAGVRNSYAAMFYLNPYHISPQPVVGSVQKTLGIPAGLMLYVISIIAASSGITALFSRMHLPRK